MKSRGELHELGADICSIEFVIDPILFLLCDFLTFELVVDVVGETTMLLLLLLVVLVVLNTLLLGGDVKSEDGLIASALSLKEIALSLKCLNDLVMEVVERMTTGLSCVSIVLPIKNSRA